MRILPSMRAQISGEVGQSKTQHTGHVALLELNIQEQNK